MRTKKILLVRLTGVVVGATLVSVAVFGQGNRKLDPVLEQVAHYREWTRVTPKPVVMDPDLALLCVGPSDLAARDTLAHRVARAEKPKPGQFSGYRVFHVYVNRIGAATMVGAWHPHFPEGSMIVKEKFLAREFELAAPEVLPRPELLTVMIKGAPGSNPSNGDWKFLVEDVRTQSFETGSVAHCEKCHRSQAKDDFVFREFGHQTLSDLYRR